MFLIRFTQLNMNITRLIRTILLCLSFLLLSLVMTREFRKQTEFKHRLRQRDISDDLRTTTTTLDVKSTHKKALTAEGDWKKVASRFKSRLQRLRSICRSKAQPPRKYWKRNLNFLVDVPRRLMICAVQKSGSTSWHRTIWAARRKRMNLSDSQSLYTPADTIANQGIAANLPQEDGDKMLNSVKGDDDFMREPPSNSSFRVILARHPFARLISGWNQKFMLSSNYWVILMKIFPKLLEYKKEIVTDRVMSFRDFARYVAENPISIRSKDAHFIPASYVCSPCEYDYTYIVKAESIDSDEQWLKQRLRISDIDVGRRGIPPGGSVVNDDLKNNIKKFMSQLPMETVKGLYELYKSDFEYFGYTFDFKTFEPGGFE